MANATQIQSGGVPYAIKDPVARQSVSESIENLALTFSTSVNYSVGDYCTYDGKFYRFIKTHSAGAWNALDVSQVRVGGQFNALIAAMHSDDAQIIAKFDSALSLKVNGKNKLNCNSATNKTINGVTFTPHFTREFLDYIEVNGTAADTTDYEIQTPIPAGSYKFSSYIDQNGYAVAFTNVLTLYYNNAGVSVWVNGDAPKSGTIGSEETITLKIRIIGGNAANHIRVYPMIRSVLDTDVNYVPYGYFDSVQQSFDELYRNRALDLRLSGRNKLNCNAAEIKTVNGITFTPHFTNGFLDYINVNGTASATADYEIESDVNHSGYYFTSFIDENGDAVTFTNVLTLYYNNAGLEVWVNGDAPRTGTIETAGPITFRIRVLNGNSVSNVKVYPMMRPTTDSNIKYEPFGYFASVQKSLDSIQKSNKLYGKTIVCCGDSITQGTDMDAEGITDNPAIPVYQSDQSGDFHYQKTAVKMVYGYQIAERNNMTFYNAGISGSTMQGLENEYGFSLADGRYTKLPDNIDYLTIWFGWNDTAVGTLGTIDDTTNESYYGGYNVVLPYLIDKYPFAKIALIVPFGCDAEHREAIRLLGNKWGVAVWDNYQGGTPLYYGKEDSVGVDDAIVTANRAKFQANGAHPNYKGQRQLADMIEEFLRGI